MLSPFPELFDFALASPLIIRIFAGVYFISAGYELARSARERGAGFTERGIGALVLFAGAMLLVGLFTQIAALVLIIHSLYSVFSSKNPVRRSLYLMLFAMTLSLLFSGAGFFAVDIPL